ncbi:MAG: sigma-70 family RNA polymerase sigma factor [Acidobacteria bacterium]|nr:sigma-70 family RNA polymerase sigma factor [Acidobacteriota bacterium]MCA1649522.1 sigma-70 family RNA polymerase sigma factor [Acidobacteriota bacterium]
MDAPALSDDRLQELMRAAQQGDAVAYRELLRSITPRIRRTLLRRRASARPEDIEDLIQDVLLSVHAVRATYDPRRPFMPWLLAITRNRLADAARRYRRTTAHEVLMEGADVTFADPKANSGQETSDDLVALADTLRMLPARQRQAFQLLKIEGLSLREASAMTGTTIGALKVATHRAIAALRKALTRNATRT